jgi:hypothetical protein
MTMKLRPIAVLAALAAGGIAAPARAADFTECTAGDHNPLGFACEESTIVTPQRERHVSMWWNDTPRGSVAVTQQSGGWYRLEVCDLMNDRIRPTMRYEDRQYNVWSVYPASEGYGECAVRYTTNIRKWRGTWRDHGTQWFVWPVGA